MLKSFYETHSVLYNKIIKFILQKEKAIAEGTMLEHQISLLLYS